MSYIAQLLPDREQAVVLRKALAAFTERDDVTSDEHDAAWSLLAKLTEQMRKNH